MVHQPEGTERFRRHAPAVAGAILPLALALSEFSGVAQTLSLIFAALLAVSVLDLVKARLPSHPRAAVRALIDGGALQSEDAVRLEAIPLMIVSTIPVRPPEEVVEARISGRFDNAREKLSNAGTGIGSTLRE